MLNKILSNADWDDTYCIYLNFHGLAIYLCSIIERYYKAGSTNTYSQAILYLIDTYDEAVIDYARTGVAYSAALLVCSEDETSRLEGLSILRVLSEADDKQMVALLLDNRDIEATGFMRELFQSCKFSKSGNVEMRQAFFSFLSNLVAHSDQEQTAEINGRFGQHYEDIFDLLEEALQNEANPLILKNCINCLQSLAYYGQQEEGENLYRPILEKKQILKHLEALTEHQALEVSTLAGRTLEYLRPY